MLRSVSEALLLDKVKVKARERLFNEVQNVQTNTEILRLNKAKKEKEDSEGERGSEQEKEKHDQRVAYRPNDL